jgi:hypothetical protein
VYQLRGDNSWTFSAGDERRSLAQAARVFVTPVTIWSLFRLRHGYDNLLTKPFPQIGGIGECDWSGCVILRVFSWDFGVTIILRG